MSVGIPIRHLDGQSKVDASLVYGDDAPQDSVMVRVIRSPHHYASFKIAIRRFFIKAP